MPERNEGECGVPPRIFLEQWRNVGFPDARFGMLSGLETGTLEVGGWNVLARQTHEGLGEYMRFLLSVVKDSGGGRIREKALQVLLKGLRDSSPAGCEFKFEGQGDFLQELLQALININFGDAIQKEPLARLVREFLAGMHFFNLAPECSSPRWHWAVITTWNADLLHMTPKIQENDIRKREMDQAIAILLEALKKEKKRIGEFLIGRSFPISALATFSKRDWLFVSWVEELLMLKTIRGDFDELIPLE